MVFKKWHFLNDIDVLETFVGLKRSHTISFSYYKQFGSNSHNFCRSSQIFCRSDIVVLRCCHQWITEGTVGESGYRRKTKSLEDWSIRRIAISIPTITRSIRGVMHLLIAMDGVVSKHNNHRWQTDNGFGSRIQLGGSF